MNVQILLKVAQVAAMFDKGQEAVEPEIEALRAAKGLAYSSTVGLGVIVAMRDVMVNNTFPDAGESFHAVNSELFATMMVNLGNAHNLDHHQVMADVKRITEKMAEVMYPGVQARNLQRREAQAQALRAASRDKNGAPIGA